MRSCSAAVKFSSLAISLAVLLAPTAAFADSSKSHTVYSGQRLGSIAKRYGITVEALCSVNGLNAKDTLRPGQQLVIPARGEAVAARPERDSARASATNRNASRRRNGTERELKTHQVESGQRLESIARRYNVSVAALRSANNISPKEPIRPGQILNIPAPGESPEEIQARLAGNKSYLRPPKRRGHIELQSYSEQFRGTPFDKRGKVSPAAYAGVSKVLAMTGNRPQLEPRLLKLLVQISDAFGGRPLRIVSGYRTTSFYQDSRHKHSHAVDLSIPGVPNEVLRDYLRTLPKVGVGYYPNSSFVHLDVREYSSYWVDYAGPGEAPRRDRRRQTPGEPEEMHEEEPGDVPLPGAQVAAEPAPAGSATRPSATAPSDSAPSVTRSPATNSPPQQGNEHSLAP